MPDSLMELFHKPGIRSVVIGVFAVIVSGWFLWDTLKEPLSPRDDAPYASYADEPDEKPYEAGRFLTRNVKLSIAGAGIVIGVGLIALGNWILRHDPVTEDDL